ncbi:alginate export family protein, partial [Microbulbifer hainanensis]|uniref:alginate export family protein n=1 Tax=Microbulbifer hainanensis TaxID=2735675 RepID=UPI001866380B
FIAATTSTAVSAQTGADDDATTPQATSIGDALRDGDLSAAFRLRFEGVDQETMSEDAAATTLRSRVTWHSAPLNGWTLLAEADNVTALGAEQFNSTSNGQTEYPVVADPSGSEINRAQLSYSGALGELTLGRQRINHDNQRFLGGVGWRQNEQTFDALRSTVDLGESVSVDYSYIWNVNRIFGPGGDNANLEGQLHALRVGYQLNPAHRLTLVHYELDFDNAAALASRTTGLHYWGESNLFKWQLGAASQAALAQNPADYRAHYYLAELSTQPLADQYKVSLNAGFELLGADGNGRFVTPLATLHKFQGFADQFLGTPADGLRDHYLGARATLAGIGFATTVHQFRADHGDADYGDEADLVASYALGGKINLLAKYARFRAEDWSGDTDKFWLAVTVTL